MKKTLVILSILGSIILPQASLAAREEICTIAPYLAGVGILSVTSAPTGTTLLLGISTDNEDCRDELLLAREDALKYRFTGELTPFLQQQLREVEAIDASISIEQIINGLIASTDQ